MLLQKLWSKVKNDKNSIDHVNLSGGVRCSERLSWGDKRVDTIGFTQKENACQLPGSTLFSSGNFKPAGTAGINLLRHHSENSGQSKQPADQSKKDGKNRPHKRDNPGASKSKGEEAKNWLARSPGPSCQHFTLALLALHIDYVYHPQTLGVNEPLVYP